MQSLDSTVFLVLSTPLFFITVTLQRCRIKKLIKKRSNNGYKFYHQSTNEQKDRDSKKRNGWGRWGQESKIQSFWKGPHFRSHSFGSQIVEICSSSSTVVFKFKILCNFPMTIKYLIVTTFVFFFSISFAFPVSILFEFVSSKLSCYARK